MIDPTGHRPFFKNKLWKVGLHYGPKRHNVNGVDEHYAWKYVYVIAPNRFDAKAIAMQTIRDANQARRCELIVDDDFVKIEDPYYDDK